MVNISVGEQWDRCDRCGFNYPVSHLTRQKGLKVCTEKCVDNTDVENHVKIVRSVLAAATTEGRDMREMDLRMVDWSEY